MQKLCDICERQEIKFIDHRWYFSALEPKSLWRVLRSHRPQLSLSWLALP